MPQPLAMSIPATAQHATRAGGACVSEGHAQRTTRRRTTIFSTEFALRLMGDVQQYFIDKKVRNFYSVSISGYHIA